MISTALEAWREEAERLDRALDRLAAEAAVLDVPLPAGEEWHELLVHKLLPQLRARPLLVVAVVGGTNIGKSVIFNHLAGETTSGVSPLAAGTKHPVCLVPPSFADEEALGEVFEAFALRRWQSADDPLEESPEHRLFWRIGSQVPEQLLLLDTPDIDSDVPVNWQRADHVRQAADVLIAVLTQQKYNDAAVKRFFRRAAEADKPVIVVFNQCDLEADRAYWPRWLATFADETGVEAQLVYVVPYDRAAADDNRLPFYRLTGEGNAVPEPASGLQGELAELHFAAIKVRTMRGALRRLLDEHRGAPAYLARLRQASGRFAAAAEAMQAAEMARVSWPTLPPQLVVDEIRDWWDEHRSAWSRRVHGFYRAVGRTVVIPMRAARDALAGAPTDAAEDFAAREAETIVTAVERLFDELERLAAVGNETLRPRLEKMLRGAVRKQLLADIRRAHAELPAIDEDYRAFLRNELARWCEQNPRAVSLLRSFDHVLALARPAITVSLAVSGWIVAGGIVHEAAVQAAGHTAAQLATEAAITGGITGGGEVVVGTTGEGLKRAAAQLFVRLQRQYADGRAAWLADWLNRHLVGDLLSELRRGAEVPSGRPFAEAEAALGALVRRAATADKP